MLCGNDLDSSIRSAETGCLLQMTINLYHHMISLRAQGRLHATCSLKHHLQLVQIGSMSVNRVPPTVPKRVDSAKQP